MQPLNSTELYLMVDGSSEIMVSPSTSFFLGSEYILFFDDVDDRFTIVGTDYACTLSARVDSDDIDEIRVIREVMLGGDTVDDETEGPAVPIEDLRKPVFSNEEQKRLLVSFSLFSIAGIIAIMLLSRMRASR